MGKTARKAKGREEEQGGQVSFENPLDAFEDEAAAAVDVSPTRATVDAFENDAERWLDFDELMPDEGQEDDRKYTSNAPAACGL